MLRWAYNFDIRRTRLPDGDLKEIAERIDTDPSIRPLLEHILCLTYENTHLHAALKAVADQQGMGEYERLPAFALSELKQLPA